MMKCTSLSIAIPKKFSSTCGREDGFMKHKAATATIYAQSKKADICLIFSCISL